MDIVYILKREDFNLDLAYSLRSVEAFVSGYDRIWFAGYKPSWIRGIKHVHTLQIGTKWMNGFGNIVAACNHADVSDDFVLFNDDFFAIRPVDLRTDINLYNKTLDAAIKDQEKHSASKWRLSFKQMRTLLRKLGSQHFMSFELHLPIIINKLAYLEIINRPEVQAHISKYGIIMSRTLYGNLCWRNPTPMHDCKLHRKQDATYQMLSGQWLSVYDHVTENLHRYPRLQNILAALPKSRWETKSIIPKDSTSQPDSSLCLTDLLNNPHEGERE